MNNAKEELAALAKKMSIDRQHIHLYILSGNIHDRVIELADDLKAEAIIIGSRNPDIQTHLLGSDAASIVRYVHVPVFVIR